MASMTKEQIAKQYLDWLDKDKSEVGVLRVVNSLNGLVNAESKAPISKEYKLSIVAEMQKLAPSHGTVLMHAENQSILLLIQTVKKKIESDEDNNS